MTRVTWSVPRGTFVGDRLDVSSLVGDDVRMTRATADEMTRRFHRQATATIERLRRAFESSNHRLAFASIRFSFRALANRMNDRPTIRGENAVPPLASRSSIVRVVRVVRVVPTSTSTPTSARAVARTAPNATRRRAPARIVHSNRPESSRPPPPLTVVLGLFFFFFSRVCDAHRTR